MYFIVCHRADSLSYLIILAPLTHRNIQPPPTDTRHMASKHGPYSPKNSPYMDTGISVYKYTSIKIYQYTSIPMYNYPTKKTRHVGPFVECHFGICANGIGANSHVHVWGPCPVPAPAHTYIRICAGEPLGWAVDGVGTSAQRGLAGEVEIIETTQHYTLYAIHYTLYTIRYRLYCYNAIRYTAIC
jgi:hypothetical protein